MLTRRDWLAMGGLLVGGLAGCRPGASRAPSYGGGLQGPSPERGHRVRQGAGREGAAADDAPVAVAILGGGAAGLSAAWALSRAGLDDFVVLELEDEPGGTARGAAARLPGGAMVTPHPLGAHYLPVPSQPMRAVCTLLQELGVLEGFDAAGRARCAEEHLCRAPQERVFYKGRWYEGLYLRAGASAEDLRQLDRFHEEVGRWVRARDGAGRRVFSVGEPGGDRRAAGAADLDGRTMAQHLDGLGLRSWRLRWLVDYGCRDDFGVKLEQASAWAGICYFAARLLHPDDHPPEVLTWPEGNGFLMARLAERIGAGRLRGGCLVSDVRPLMGADEGVEIRYLRGAEGAPRRLRARHVIFALPSFLRRHLLAPLRQAPPGYLAAFSYAPWLVANLLLRRPPPAPVAGGMPVPGGPRVVPGYPQCWDNVLLESPGLGYVVATHQREAALPPDGVPRTVFTYYRPLCGPDPRHERERLLAADWTALSAEVVRDLSRAEPSLLRDVERIDICRWGHGMIRPVPGLLTGEALAQARAPLGSIHFAHSDLSGLALFEEAQAAGVRAAQAVLRERAHPFEALL